MLLIALWVRSYRKLDAAFRFSPTTDLAFISDNGYLYHFRDLKPPKPTNTEMWDFVSRGTKELPQGIHWEWSTVSFSIRFPHWLPVIVLFALSACPWIRRFPWSNRFSLRTLLIATTLVAVVLGLVVWAAR